MSKRLIVAVTLGAIGAVGLVCHYISKWKKVKDKERQIKMDEQVLMQTSLPDINTPKMTTENVNIQTGHINLLS